MSAKIFKLFVHLVDSIAARWRDRRLLIGAAAALALATSHAATLPTYTISGTVSGLLSGTSVTLTLKDSGTYNTTLSANGAFRFAPSLPYRSRYSITVSAQPTGEYCNVTNPAGTLYRNVTNVQVVCASSTPPLIIAAANSDNNAIYDLLFSGTFALANVDPITTDASSCGYRSKHCSFDSIVWNPNSVTQSVDLIAADSGNRQIVRYQGSGLSYGASSLVFAWSSSSPGAGPSLPNGLSVDRSGNLFVVSSGWSDYHQSAGLWVLPFNSSPTGGGGFCKPVLIDQTFGGVSTQVLTESVVAQATTALWNLGDLLVLSADQQHPRVMVYTSQQIKPYLTCGTPPAPLTKGPSSTAVSSTQFAGAVPVGMDVWPSDQSLLITTHSSGILRFQTNSNPGVFVLPFATAPTVGLQKIRSGILAGSPYAFVTQAGSGGDYILQFGAPPANNSNTAPLARVSTGIDDPMGLAVATSGSAPASSCASTTGCMPLPGLPVNIAGSSTSQVTGNLLQTACTVNPDPRVTSINPWTCNGDALPIGAGSVYHGTTYCPSFPYTVIPGSMCGASGTLQSGFVAVESASSGVDSVSGIILNLAPALNEFLPAATNLGCQSGSLPLVAWGPRSDLPAAEGFIPEDILTPGTVINATVLCDGTAGSGRGGLVGEQPAAFASLAPDAGTVTSTSGSGSRGASMWAFGLELNWGIFGGGLGATGGVRQYILTLFANLNATLADSSVDSTALMPLTQHIANSQSAFTTLTGANPPNPPHLLDCAEAEIWAADADVFNNPNNFHNNFNPSATGWPSGILNPYGDLRARLETLFTSYTSIYVPGGAAPMATGPANNLVPACVWTMSAVPATGNYVFAGLPGYAALLGWSAVPVPGVACQLGATDGIGYPTATSEGTSASNLSTGTLTKVGPYTATLSCTGPLGPSYPDSNSASLTVYQPYYVSVAITGLNSGAVMGTVVLQDNGLDSLSETNNGTFAFATPLANVQAYNVTVSGQPTGQTCTVTGGTGPVAGNVTVPVNCVTNTVSGSVSGLTSGTTVVLQDNGGDNLSLSAPGNFTFATPLNYHQNYAVTVLTQPTGQTCTVSNGTGGPVAGPVTGILVTCVPNTVSGTLSGLASGTVVLQDNGADNLSLTSNGAFTFATPLNYHQNYAVTVSSQPNGQSCTVSSGAGGPVAGPVTGIVVTCVINTVKGTLSGLTPGTTAVLQDNGADNLSLTSNGAFTFATPLNYGNNYNVTVSTLPIGENCTPSSNTGGPVTGPVTGVVVTCIAYAYTVGGTITGLTGPVVLQDNSGDSLTLSANGSFTFATPVNIGANFAVSVLTQPAGETCTVGSGSGAISSSPVTSVVVTCTPYYNIGGTVSGLSGTVVLQDNGGDNLSLTANGAFAFATAVLQGNAYAATVLTQPAGETCAVSGGDSGTGSGIVGAGPVTSVVVNCTTNAPPPVISLFAPVAGGNGAAQPGAAPNTYYGTYSVLTIIGPDPGDPTITDYRTPLDVQWSATNANACTISEYQPPNTSYTGLAASSSALTIDALAIQGGGRTETFRLDCTGAAGTPTATAFFSINIGTPPTVSLAASPNPVALGQTVTLTWTLTGEVTFDLTSTCQLTIDGVTSTIALNGATGGSTTYTPTATGSTVQSITCSSPEYATGSSTSVLVLVNPPSAPAITSFTANGLTATSSSNAYTNTYTITNLPAGNSETVSWTTTNAVADGCTITNPTDATSGGLNGSGQPPSGSHLVVAPQAVGSSVATYYTLTCQGGTGTTPAVAVLTIIVNPASAPQATLIQPNGLAFAANGNLYVASSGSGQVLVYTPGGYGSLGYGQYVLAPALTLSAGLSNPVRLAFDSAGNLYVADIGNNSVVVFNSAGVQLPNATISVNRPLGVAVDDLGNVYVAENTNSRIDVYNYLSGLNGPPTLVNSWTIDAGNNQVTSPGALAFNASQGTIAVADAGTEGVIFYNKLQACCTATPTPIQTLNGSNSSGNGPNGPTGIAFDANNLTYVSNYSGNDATVYNTGNSLLLTVGLLPTPYTPGPPIATPEGIAVDSTGNIYVSNTPANVIYVYNSAGVYQYTIGNIVISATYNSAAGAAFLNWSAPGLPAGDTCALSSTDAAFNNTAEPLNSQYTLVVAPNLSSGGPVTYTLQCGPTGSPSAAALIQVPSTSITPSFVNGASPPIGGAAFTSAPAGATVQFNWSQAGVPSAGSCTFTGDPVSSPLALGGTSVSLSYTLPNTVGPYTASVTCNTGSGDGNVTTNTSTWTLNLH